jgi:class 3 adenylate cyclase
MRPRPPGTAAWSGSRVRQLTRSLHVGTGGNLATLAPSWTDPGAIGFLARYERLSATPGVAAHAIELTDLIDVRSILASIRAPTRIIHRRSDTFIPLAKAQAVANGIPGAELFVLDGRDHLVYVDQEPVLNAVEAFIAGTATAPPADRVLTTVLFVDVVAPTGLAQSSAHPRWRQVLSRFSHLARDLLARFRGTEIVSTGDGLLATFDGPARAVRCGQSLQRSAAGLELSLRIGVHTAEVERLGDDISGLGVRIGASVAAAATPGEVWVTRTVRDLVAGSGLEFESRGAHDLTGVREPWELHAALA